MRSMKAQPAEKVWDVVVLGGGPAGMMAAGRAAERGRNVLLLEKNSKLGKKLLITGGGRCNVANNKPDMRALLARYGTSSQYLFSPFSQFGFPETYTFFTARGLSLKEENEGRLFPVSDSARSVWDVMVAYLRKSGATIQCGAVVAGFRYEKSEKTFVVTLQDKSIVRARACVVATGGTSRPETGSTGEGFRFLKRLGHRIAAHDMSLVPVTLSDAWVERAAGVSLPGVKLTTYLHKTKQKAYRGKVLFTHVGISGPTVLNMSRDVGMLLAESEGSEYEAGESSVAAREAVTIRLDLFPDTDHAGLKGRLHEVLTAHSNKLVRNALAALVPTALVEPILHMVSIDAETPAHSVQSSARKALIMLLKAVPLHVSGLLGAEKAIVSSGGVPLDEIDTRTMESRKVPGLYVVGDMLDINRPSGGYSLQLCWSTGYVAGEHV